MLSWYLHLHVPTAIFYRDKCTLHALTVLRPSFAKQIISRTLMDLLANDLLDEAHEATLQIAATALASVPGRLTLGWMAIRRANTGTFSLSLGQSLGCVLLLGQSTCAPHADYWPKSIHCCTQVSQLKLNGSCG